MCVYAHVLRVGLRKGQALADACRHDQLNVVAVLTYILVMV